VGSTVKRRHVWLNPGQVTGKNAIDIETQTKEKCKPNHHINVTHWSLFNYQLRTERKRENPLQPLQRGKSLKNNINKYKLILNKITSKPKHWIN
jgi:hypothetical protein